MTTTAFQSGPGDALIVIDPQIDFCPGGALAVEGGDEVMGGINSIAAAFPLIVVTQDWHPAGHQSFASSHPGKHPFDTIAMPYGEQILWPDHCIQGTPGAAFQSDIAPTVDRAALIVRKGLNGAVDSYSAFYENDKVTRTGLAGFLRDKGVTRCVLVGLAYDFCVAWSALDARRDGFEAVVLKQYCRAIGMPLADGQTTATVAEARFAQAGVALVA
jgi:nicotinamidase/pyrazinamidase